MIDAAVSAGCDAVKFQKRTPEICVPESQKGKMRETPWGYISYIDYRHRVEFGVAEYQDIDAYCKEHGVDWFTSCWDQPSIEFMKQFSPVCYKIPSACITNHELLRAFSNQDAPLIMSTGMSTLEEVDKAVDLLAGRSDVPKPLNSEKVSRESNSSRENASDKGNYILLHCTSTYPCIASELNLRVIDALRDRYDVPVGYSGHEAGLQASVAAVALGACVVERHITLDRTMWGTDQAASVEPHGMARLVRDIRVVEQALGDGIKRVYKSEQAVRDKLRR
jgi:N-acetylneuraminate synthase